MLPHVKRKSPVIKESIACICASKLRQTPMRNERERWSVKERYGEREDRTDEVGRERRRWRERERERERESVCVRE